MAEEKKLAYTPAEFGALFGKSQSWAYRQLYAGKVEAITDYGRTMIPASEAEKILAQSGRYNGAGLAVRDPEKAKMFPSLKSKQKRGGAAWRKAVSSRRSKPGNPKKRRASRPLPGSRRKI